jgi:hypothetical protein
MDAPKTGKPARGQKRAQQKAKRQANEGNLAVKRKEMDKAKVRAHTKYPEGADNESIHHSDR